MRLRFIPLVFLFCSLVYGNSSITLEWLTNKPRTFAKDFYIWQYLQQDDVTPQNAIDALGQANHVSNKLFYAYTKKLAFDETTAVMQCMKATPTALVETNADCIKVGLSLKKAATLSNLELDSVISKVETSYPSFTKQLKIINAVIPFSKLISSDINTFYAIYLKTPKNFQNSKLNYKLPKRKLAKIKKDKRFEQLLQNVITNPKLNLLQASFFELDDSKLSFSSSFYLALNRIQHNLIDFKTNEYLENAYNKAVSQKNKDKILFWNYLVTQADVNLYALMDSSNINIYTLFAHEFFKKEFTNILTTVLKEPYSTDNSYNPLNQFHWIKVITDIKDDFPKDKLSHYELIMNQPRLVPQLAFLYSKFSHFNQSYYISPYQEYLDQLDVNRQALINAIALKESYFISSSISSTSAIGVMQLMPFLIETIAKHKEEKYELLSLFEPKKNIEYANQHLEYLEQTFSHPLYVAYAYDAGAKFTKDLLKGNFFKFKNKFDPYLSMELIPYPQTREYGKQVLVNYIIYLNQNEEQSTTLNVLLESLMKPKED